MISALRPVGKLRFRGVVWVQCVGTHHLPALDVLATPALFTWFTWWLQPCPSLHSPAIISSLGFPEAHHSLSPPLGSPPV